MNYIREELLRQQELLVVLLTGRTVRTPPEQLQTAERESWMETAPSPEWEAGIWAGAGTVSDTVRGRNAADLAAGALLETPGEHDAGEAAALRPALETLSAGQTAFLEAALRAADGRRGAMRQMETENMPAARGSTANGAALSAVGSELPAGTAETGEVRLVTELRRTEGGGLSDAAALSRAFQRDARRYDGGFRLY